MSLFNESTDNAELLIDVFNPEKLPFGQYFFSNESIENDSIPESCYTSEIHLKPTEPDPDDINVISKELVDREWDFIDYADLTVKLTSIGVGSYAHPYIAAAYVVASATTLLTALASSHLESDEFDNYAKLFLKVQNGFLRHVGIMGMLRDAQLDSSFLCETLKEFGLDNFKREYWSGLFVNTTLNVFSTFMGEAHADLSNIVLEKFTKGKLEMEHESFLEYRGPLTAFKRLIKHSVGSIFKDHGLLPIESSYESWFKGLPYVAQDDDGPFKLFSMLNHFAANLPVASWYNGFTPYIFTRTLSHSIMKYGAEFLSYNIMENIGFNGLFSAIGIEENGGYIKPETDASKIGSLFFGSLGYSLSKELWA